MINQPKPVARMYAGLSAPQRKAGRRARLLEAGLELFGTAGYPATTIPDVCARAGVTARHFYEEFESREALLTELFDDLAQSLFDRVRDALVPGDKTLGELVSNSCAAYVHFFTSDPRRARIFSVEVAGVSRELDLHRMHVRRKFARLNIKSVERLRDYEFDPGVDLRAVATILNGAADVMMNEWVLSRELSPATMIESLSTIWLRTLNIDHFQASQILQRRR